MGLLPAGRRPHSYDPGRFWSGDDLRLTAGFALGGEIGVTLPPASERNAAVAARRIGGRQRFRQLPRMRGRRSAAR